MTLKEADQVALMGWPIIHQKPGQPAVEYRRITQTGLKYTDTGKRVPYVQLLDKNGTSVTEADPAYCNLKEEVEQ